MGCGNMSLIDSTKKLLISYGLIISSIENLKDQLNNMEYNGLRTTKIDGMPSNANNSSITEIEALIMISKKEVMKKNLEKSKTIIRVIYRGLDSLSKVEKQVIVGYYIEGKTWDELSEIVAFSVRTCNRIRNEGLKKMTVSIYGYLE